MTDLRIDGDAGRISKRRRDAGLATASSVMLAVVTAFAGTAAAADLSGPGTVVVEEPTGLTFSAGAYVWGASLTGTVGVGRLGPAEIDASFSDVLSNIDIAFMAVAEARYERFGVFGDLLYSKLSASGSGPRGLLGAELDNELFVGTLMGEARVVEAGGSSLDIMAGARVWHVGADLALTAPRRTFSRSGDKTWVDPMIGAKGRLKGASPFYATGWAMIGGFGAGSDFGWDVFGGVGYEISDRFSFIAGYRGLGVDYQEKDLLFDVIQHGPIVSGIYNF